MAETERELDLLRRRVLGWGLALEEISPGLDHGRDLVLSPGPDRKLATVEALENLHQDLTVALTTLLGSDVFNSSFGFDGLNALVEETNPVLMRERIRIAVVLVLRNDPRIRRIVDVKFLDGRLDAQIAEPAGDEPVDVMRASRTFSVRVAFETLTGEQANLNLGEIPPNA